LRGEKGRKREKGEGVFFVRGKEGGADTKRGGGAPIYVSLPRLPPFTREEREGEEKDKGERRERSDRLLDPSILMLGEEGEGGRRTRRGEGGKGKGRKKDS